MSDILDLIRACAAGDVQARKAFQDEYGKQIYDFPTRRFRLPKEEAGDFYVYVFDDGRLFKRLGTFEGRNNIPFLTYLRYYPLKHLFLEWRRTLKDIETESWDSAEGEGRTLQEKLPDPAAATPGESRGSEEQHGSWLWDLLSPEERLHFKLFHLLYYDLSPEEVSLLAHLSRRSVLDTLALVAEVQEGLIRKDEKAARLRDELDSVQGWIRLRQKEVQEIDEKMRLLSQTGQMPGPKLARRRKALELALTKRYRQRTKLLQDIQKQKLTTSYKDMARLLNTKEGTVGSLLSRLYDRLAERLGKKRTGKEQPR